MPVLSPSSLYQYFALLVGCGIGLGLMAYGFIHYLKYHQAKHHWLSTRAKVTHIAIGFYHGFENDLLDFVYPKITYQYYYNNQQYLSKQVAFSINEIAVMRPKFNDLIGRYESLNIWWNDLQLGDSINIKLNPNNPEQAIIDYPSNLYNNQKRRWRYLVILLSGLLVVILFLILFL